MSTRRSNSGRKQGNAAKRFFVSVLVLVLLGIVGWFLWLYGQINDTAQIDNAQQADAIAVFGAAEYGGRPSPVLHARLDKAVLLYNKNIAPYVITLGGGQDKDSGKTEGGVGRDYLLANGIPYDHIIPETRSIDTEQQVQLLADIAHKNHFNSIVVVSDGTHLFRIALLCRRAGLKVYTSPRATVGRIDTIDSAQRMWHEMLSYTFLRTNLHVSWMHRWLEGKLN
ncbi:YdcF family protein [Granulicella cerasi]|uniref:YdcF family protein n=1 Tax=Granulicella cerasi TaxID=741063 RepID=A0ABW1Z6H3_9BACT|nr:YdcF family protein [Granulicella cerasi]